MAFAVPRDFRFSVIFLMGAGGDDEADEVVFTGEMDPLPSLDVATDCATSGGEGSDRVPGGLLARKTASRSR